MMKIGSVVTLKNNPYVVTEKLMPHISGDFNHTPPFMVVIELLYSSSPLQEQIPTQVHCMFFSERENKFKSVWMGYELLKLVHKLDAPDNVGLEERAIERNLLQFKHNGQQFVLLSTDFEMSKKNINQTDEGSKKNITIRNFYNHLPPVLTATDYRKREDRKPSLLKIGYKFEVKCKWYNPKEDKFSEEFIPYEALKPVNTNFDESFANFLREEGMLFLGLNPIFKKYSINIEVEGSKKSFHPILKFRRIRFNHYKYFIDFTNVYNKENISIEYKKLIEDHSEQFDEQYLPYHKPFNTRDAKVEEKSENNRLIFYNLLKFKPEFKALYSKFENGEEQFFNDDSVEKMKGNFFTIKYMDELNRLTIRSIYVTDVENISSTDKHNSLTKPNYIIKGYCLLRSGKVRHFITERIISIKQLKFNDLDIFDKRTILSWLTEPINR